MYKIILLKKSEEPQAEELEKENTMETNSVPEHGQINILEDRYEFIIPDWGPIYDRSVLKDYLERTTNKQEFIDVVQAIALPSQPELNDVDTRQVDVFHQEFKILEKNFEKLVPLYKRNPNHWQEDRSSYTPEQRLGVEWNDEFGSKDEDHNVCENFTDSLTRLMDTLDYLMPICQGNRNQSCMNVSQTMLKFEFVLANAASAHCAKLLSTQLVEEEKTEKYA